jgi:hypothetical protein
MKNIGTAPTVFGKKQKKGIRKAGDGYDAFRPYFLSL